MENPYWKAEVKPHYLDRDVVRTKCFDVFNIISASVALAGEYEMGESDDDGEPSSMFKLHHRLAEPRLSQLLLDISVFVRTFDDLMSSEAPDLYTEYSAKTDGHDYIGTLDSSGKFGLRDACNKIIHATNFRPVYDFVESDLGDGSTRRAWHLDGQIEIEGSQGNKSWEAVLYVNNFLEIVLDRIEFEPPAPGSP